MIGVWISTFSFTTDGVRFHRRCFKCQTCDKKLDSTTAGVHAGAPYCKGCHKKVILCSFILIVIICSLSICIHVPILNCNQRSPQTRRQRSTRTRQSSLPRTQTRRAVPGEVNFHLVQSNYVTVLTSKWYKATLILNTVDAEEWCLRRRRSRWRTTCTTRWR